MKIFTTHHKLLALALLSLASAGCQTMGATPVRAPAKTAAVLDTDQRTRELYLSVIGQLIQFEKYHAALAHIDEFERIFKPDSRSHALRADAWLALGEWAKAEKEYRIVASEPRSGAGLHGLGRVAAARGAWAEGVTLFEQAVQEQPTNILFLNDLGNAYSEVGRAGDARFTLKKARELMPEGAPSDRFALTSPSQSGPSLPAPQDEGAKE